MQITGYGESLTIKTPTFAEDLAVTPVAAAAACGFKPVRRQLNQAPFYFSRLIEFVRA